MASCFVLVLCLFLCLHECIASDRDECTSLTSSDMCRANCRCGTVTCGCIPEAADNYTVSGTYCSNRDDSSGERCSALFGSCSAATPVSFIDVSCANPPDPGCSVAGVTNICAGLKEDECCGACAWCGRCCVPLDSERQKPVEGFCYTHNFTISECSKGLLGMMWLGFIVTAGLSAIGVYAYFKKRMQYKERRRSYFLRLQEESPAL
eukprot:GILK01006797.1.p1 GENE.GILK01006797.1~~GILK01006797.1.p1  ORF type:complete len:207 (+),score=2.93 GILK01006797.1:34-654(+)